MSIENQYQERIKRIQETLVKGIAQDILLMAKERVPVDTRTLQNKGISVSTRNTKWGAKITLYVNNRTLKYEDQTIKAKALGLLLDIGVRKGKTLRRSKSQVNNPAGTPTKGWFTIDLKKDIEFYFSRKRYRKWLTTI